MRIQDLPSYQFYMAYSSVKCIYHAVHSIPSTYLSQNCKFTPFNYFHPIPHPSPAASSNINLTSSSSRKPLSLGQPLSSFDIS